MDDTATATSNVKTCDGCGAPFGENDDGRYKDCAKCRGAAPEIADATGATEAPSYEALRIDIPKDEIPEAPPKTYYWCGATMDAPHSNYTLGGVSFPKTTGSIIERAEGRQECVPDTDVGVVNHVTDTQRNLILEHVKTKVIRNLRETKEAQIDGTEMVRRSGDIITMKSGKVRKFVPQPGDIPIGCFVYMVKVRHRDDRPIQDPPSLVKRDF